MKDKNFYGGYMENIVNKKEKKELTRNQKRLIFYVLMLIWPVLQVSIFYFYVNINSFLLAFQKFTPKADTIGYDISFAGFENFKVAWNELIVGKLYMIGNSLKFFAIDFPISLTFCLSFSFYIYKKYPLSGLFKTFLFMPQIISSLTLGIMYKFLVDYGYRDIVSLIHYGNQPMTPQHIEAIKEAGLYIDGGLLSMPDKAMLTIIIFNIWFSFGVNMLMYSSAMSGIDESVVESAQLDGCNVVQEFIHISIPLIYPTLVSLLIVGLSGLFTNTLGLMTLYGHSANIPREVHDKVMTLGFELFLHTSLIGNVDDQQFVEFTAGELSAWGLMISAIMVPLILSFRKLLNKFGPSVD